MDDRRAIRNREFARPSVFFASDVAGDVNVRRKFRAYRMASPKVIADRRSISACMVLFAIHRLSDKPAAAERRCSLVSTRYQNGAFDRPSNMAIFRNLRRR